MYGRQNQKRPDNVELMEPEIFIITRNPGKLLAAQKASGPFGITCKQLDKDYPKIQTTNSTEIAKYTAIKAVKEFNVPVFREDHSLFIHALGSFPGPYANYFARTMPVELLLEILSNFEDRSAHMELAAVLATPDGGVFEFVQQV